jgi:hypothetical protein
MVAKFIGSARTVVHACAVGLLALGLLGGATSPGWAQAADGHGPGPGADHGPGMRARGGEDHWQAMQARRDEWLKQRLDASAERLELKASQMPAWQSFSTAFIALHQHPPMGAQGAMGAPGAKPDAAALVHLEADHAADHARKLAAVADAATTLQASMSDNQRSLFSEMVRHHIGMMHRHHERHGDGDHDGGDGGPMHRWHHAGAEGPDDGHDHAEMESPDGDVPGQPG